MEKERVLVIEDSKLMNNIISKKLSELNFHVDCAYSLKEADKFLSKYNYELVILDLHLPDGEGTELIVDIQTVTKTKIIVLTSMTDELVRDELFKYGILDYIIKDKNLHYSIEEVIRIIRLLKEKKKDKVLVIDDSRFVCNQVKRVLEPRDYIVDFALTGKEGIEKARKGIYSLIVLDIELPDIKGTKVLEDIRADENLVDIPIIVLSGTADAETIRYILKNGANDYVKKPFVFEEFLLRVDLWISYCKQGKELAKKNKELAYLTKHLEERVKEETEKNLEKDRLLFAQSRLAQIGEMMSAVAHQWKQPLSSLSALINRTFLRYKRNNYTIDRETMEFCFENANLQIKSMSDTIHNFMNFFKPDNKKQKFNVYQAVRRALKLIKPVLDSECIKVTIDIDRKVYMEGYPNEFGQILINLLTNAKDAFIENNISDREIKIYSEIKDNSFILSVEDNAGGIPEEIKYKIFEPYFSTKGNVGTGLGLYISKLIIENYMHGKLNVENTKKGAKFSMVFPVSGILLENEDNHKHGELV